jgi:hypothetical protein
MIRSLMLALIALLLLGLPAFAADDSGRHSGRALEVKDGGRMLVLEEMGPWHGPNTGLYTRSIELTPGATVRLVRRTGEWANDASPGYEAAPIDVKDLKPGDFVTVIMGGGRAAASMEVMAPDGSGLASPKLDSGK